VAQEEALLLEDPPAPGRGGNGGNATSTATATAAEGHSATALSYAAAGPGGTGGFFGSNGTAGTANATSNATAVGSGQASAQAVASGASAGAAMATSTSTQGANRSVSASGTAPVGGNASAVGENASAQTLTFFAGSGFGLPGISAGTSISNATGQPKGYSLTPNVASAFGHGPADGLGAMSIGYGGQGQSLTYQTTATFQVTHPANADFLIGFESQSSLGTGFDSAMLEVFVNSFLAYQTSFASLADAQAFFTDNPVDIGLASPGPATVDVVFDLTGSQLSSGFQFDYALGTELAFGPWSHRRCRNSGPAVGERWSSRLVATAAEDRLTTNIPMSFVSVTLSGIRHARLRLFPLFRGRPICNGQSGFHRRDPRTTCQRRQVNAIRRHLRPSYPIDR